MNGGCMIKLTDVSRILKGHYIVVSLLCSVYLVCLTLCIVGSSSRSCMRLAGLDSVSLFLEGNSGKVGFVLITSHEPTAYKVFVDWFGSKDYTETEEAIRENKTLAYQRYRSKAGGWWQRSEWIASMFGWRTLDLEYIDLRVLYMPSWLPFTAINLLLGSWLILRTARCMWRKHHNQCMACGYALRELTENRCPECGRSFIMR